jgi:hypothetical protein
MKKIIITSVFGMLDLVTINEAIKHNVDVLAIIRADYKK